jgi:5-aminopentanamidase
VRIAAYQAPLLPPGCMDGIELMRTHVRRCETEGIGILCCPEGILGGLADNHPNPLELAMSTEALKEMLLPLASDSVTTIVGFSELERGGRIYNSAAIFHRGEIAGLYRKLHPAIRRSVYSAGCEVPVFKVADLTFGIVICNDSNDRELASLIARQGATALFVPTNNALNPKKAGAELVARARKCDITAAEENGMWIIRADVAGDLGDLVSNGSSGIVDPKGLVVRSARQMSEDLLIAEIDVSDSPLMVRRFRG